MSLGNQRQKPLTTHSSVEHVVRGLHGRVRDYARRIDWARQAEKRWAIDRQCLEEQLQDQRAEAIGLREQAAAIAVASAAAQNEVSSLRQSSTNCRTQSVRQTVRSTRDTVNTPLNFDDVNELDPTDPGRDCGSDGKPNTGPGLAMRAGIRIQRILLKVLPFSRDVQFIGSHYGRACGSFFLFQRFLFGLSLSFALLHLPLFIPHAIAIVRAGSASSLCPIPSFWAPCVMFYGAFYREDDPDHRDPWLGLQYLGATLCSSGFLLYLAVSRWHYWNGQFQSEQLEEDLRPRPWSKLALQAWDFRLETDESRLNWSQSLLNGLRSLQAEDDEIVARGRQTQCQRYVALLRKTVGALLNLLLIIVAWLAVLYTTKEQKSIAKHLGDWFVAANLGRSAGDKAGALAPNLAVNAIGSALPALTTAITDFEGWPPAEMARQNLWRLFGGKILNLVVIVAINFEMMHGKPLYGQASMIEKHDATVYACAEDQAGATMLSFVVTEGILTLWLSPLWGLASAWAWHRGTGRNVSTFKKPVFDIPDTAVNLLYFQMLLWTTTLLVPALVLLVPVILYLHFKWLKLSLVHLSSRPFVAETCGLTVTLLQLLVFACLFHLGLSHCLAVLPLPHASGCGPFDSDSRPIAVVKSLFGQGWLNSAWNIVDAFFDKSVVGILVGAVCAVALVAVLHTSGGLKAHRVALEGLQASMKHQVQLLENELWRMERRSELLKKRLAWHEGLK